MATHDDTSAPFAPLSAEQERAILETRARALARRPVDAEVEPELVLVELQLGDRRYALEQRFVRRVIRRPPITPLPSTHDELLGMAAWAGRVLPCFDLARLVGGAPSPSHPAPGAPPPKLVIVGTHDDELAVAVDEVIGTCTARAEEIASTPDTAAPGLVLGVAPGALHLLDGARLLADPRLSLPPLGTGTPRAS